MVTDVIDKRLNNARKELNLALQAVEPGRVASAIQRMLQYMTGVQNSRLFERHRLWRRQQRQFKSSKHRQVSGPDVPTVPVEAG